MRWYYKIYTYLIENEDIQLFCNYTEKMRKARTKKRNIEDFTTRITTINIYINKPEQKVVIK